MLTFQQEPEEFQVRDENGVVVYTGDEGWWIYRGYSICEEKLKKPKPSNILSRSIKINKEINPWNQI